MRSRRPLSTSNDAMATAASCCVSPRVLGVTARFFEGVFFTELGDAIAVTRRRGDAIVSGLVLLGPMGSDRAQAPAAISAFCLPFTFHFFSKVATIGPSSLPSNWHTPHQVPPLKMETKTVFSGQCLSVKLSEISSILSSPRILINLRNLGSPWSLRSRWIFVGL